MQALEGTGLWAHSARGLQAFGVFFASKVMWTGMDSTFLTWHVKLH